MQRSLNLNKLMHMLSFCHESTSASGVFVISYTCWTIFHICCIYLSFLCLLHTRSQSSLNNPAVYLGQHCRHHTAPVDTSKLCKQNQRHSIWICLIVATLTFDTMNPSSPQIPAVSSFSYSLFCLEVWIFTGLLLAPMHLNLLDLQFSILLHMATHQLIKQHPAVSLLVGARLDGPGGSIYKTERFVCYP